MPSNTKENGFETLIVDTLVNSNGYEQGVTTEYNKQYARSFCYCVSRAAYAAKLAASVGIDRSMLAETIDALVKNVCQTEDTAGCVEEVLQELKK